MAIAMACYGSTWLVFCLISTRLFRFLFNNVIYNDVYPTHSYISSFSDPGPPRSSPAQLASQIWVEEGAGTFFSGASSRLFHKIPGPAPLPHVLCITCSARFLYRNRSLVTPFCFQHIAAANGLFFLFYELFRGMLGVTMTGQQK